MILRTILGLCLATGAAAAVIPDARVVPPDFQEIDYGKVVWKDIMRLTVTSPYGLRTSSAAGGLWQKISLNLFIAEISRNYRGTHRGDFNGTYNPPPSPGEGGSGDPPEWRGAANAGKRLLAPMIADVMFIAVPSDAGLAAAVTSCEESFRRVYGFDPPLATSLLINDFLVALYYSANWTPETSFGRESDFQTSLVATNEYRMINKSAIWYDTNVKGDIDRGSTMPGEEFVNGYTPVIPFGIRPAPSSSPLPFSYIPGLAGPAMPHFGLNIQPRAAIMTRYYSTAINVEGFAIVAIGGQIPWVWDQLSWVARADGTWQCRADMSFFPTHWLYQSTGVDDAAREPVLYRHMEAIRQSNSRLGEFIYETGFYNPVAPHTRSGLTMSGESHVF